MMNTEEKNRFLRELTLNLQHKGFIVKQGAEEGILTVELDGRRLCSAVDTGVIRYRKEDTEGNIRNAALNKVTDIARATVEYMSQIEAAPQLGIGPKGDYRLLADFNDVVLTGHPTQYGVEFITWERVQKGTALYQGDYYGPGEMMKYCSALAVEDPTTFSEAVSIAMNIDDYEQVTEDPAEYGEHNLRLAGAGDEILDMLNGYADFERLGRDIMEEECVRQTEFGLVRRLSEPFPRQEMGQTMKGMV